MGLLDADVFGPSIPTMMNLDESPEMDKEDFILPLNNFGLKVINNGEEDRDVVESIGIVHSLPLFPASFISIYESPILDCSREMMKFPSAFVSASVRGEFASRI